MNGTMKTEGAQLTLKYGDVIEIHRDGEIGAHTCIEIDPNTNNHAYIVSDYLVVREGKLEILKENGKNNDESLRHFFYETTNQGRRDIFTSRWPDRYFVIRDANTERCRITIEDKSENEITMRIEGLDAHKVRLVEDSYSRKMIETDKKRPNSEEFSTTSPNPSAS